MVSPKEVAEILLAERLPLTAYIASVTRDFHLAEDIFQEVCVKAIGRVEGFQSAPYAINWFRMVARNRAVDVMRRSREQYVGLSEELLATLEADWPSSDESDAMQRALERCFERLTAYNHELLRLRYFERRSGAEVAAAVGRKLDTVYQALARIHKSLGDCVRRQLAGEGVA